MKNEQKSIETFGIIGGGEFGKVAMSQLVPPDCGVLGCDTDPDVVFPHNVEPVDFETCAQADVVLLALPFRAAQLIVPQLAKIVPASTLITDVCSVKMMPTELFESNGLLNRKNTLMTHPLFGPQSVKNGIEGKATVVTHQKGERAEVLLNFWQQKGSLIVRMTAEAHDREMAKVHVLTFLVGRTLLKMGVEDSPLKTRYFSELMDLVEIEKHHTDELFETIQKHNPFARSMREDFIATVQKLHQTMCAPDS